MLVQRASIDNRCGVPFSIPLSPGSYRLLFMSPGATALGKPYEGWGTMPFSNAVIETEVAAGTDSELEVKLSDAPLTIAST